MISLPSWSMRLAIRSASVCAIVAGLLSVPIWPAAAQVTPSLEIQKGLERRPPPRPPLIKGNVLLKAPLIVQEPEPAPSVTLAITFGVDRSDLVGDDLANAANLGQALQNLPGDRFEIGGHTDASGSDEYNLKLSRVRAQAVVDYLSSTFGIAKSRLVPVGYGKHELLEQYGVTARQQRRVVVTNLGPPK